MNSESKSGPQGAATGDKVAAELAAAIHEHRLAPGAKLNEDDVGAVYGVSRTVARAALMSLSHQRLVELRRNRGAYVAQPSAREAREIFEARSLLEPRTARSAAERMTEDRLRRLQQHLDDEHAALEAGDTGRAVNLSGQFHIEIAHFAEQTTIAEFIAQLVSRSSLIIALYWRRRSALCDSHAHVALLRAFQKRDGALAEDLMKSHLLDLVTSLDLRNLNSAPRSLAEALKR